MPDTKDKPRYNVMHKSPLFGSSTGGHDFDQGAFWHPIQAVTVHHDNGTIRAIQAKYAVRSTLRFGAPHSDEHSCDRTKIELGDDEYIKGISGTVHGHIETLDIHTNHRTFRCGNVTHNNAKPFHYQVPEGHKVVSFHGHATRRYILGIGVTYARIVPKFTPQPGDDPQPVLTSWSGQIFLTPILKQQWAAQGAAFREQIRQKGTKDLEPIYRNVNENGMNAFAWYKIGDQKLLISSSLTGMIYTWSQDLDPSEAGLQVHADKKAVHIQTGSYSATGTTLGISQYVWSNVG